MAINSDRLALFVIATGPRGSLKTLLLTEKVVERLLKYYYKNLVEGTNFRVWSNYPVVFYHHSLMEHKTVKLASEPLNMEALYTFDKELANGWVFIDELDQWFDRQDWSNASQKLTHAAMTQVRKKKLSMGATVQDLDWINGRIAFQADMEIGCREAAFSPFGSKINLDLGEASFLKWKDLSGVMTGYRYKETGREYDQMFWGKRFWNCYDTNYQFDPTETKVRYKLKTQTRIINFGDQQNGGAALPDDQSSLPYDKPRSAKQNPDHILLADIVDQLRKSGEKTIETKELWRIANSRGLQGSKVRLGDYLHNELKMETAGRFYRLRMEPVLI